MERLAHTTALVTGGASGLGKAIAQRLAAEGATVVITDLQAELGNAAAADHHLTFLEQDVRDEGRWDEVVRGVEDRFGAVNVLVNNAGIVGPADAVDPESTRLEDWRRLFAVNVEGVFLGCRAAIPAMRRAGGGSIINISSVAGLLATPYATAYGATKAAVRQLTKSVAQHCVEQRLAIRCNSVHPGDVRTPLWDRLSADLARVRGISADEVLEGVKQKTPMGEFVQPEDIAAAVAFLASRDSHRITGEQIVIDGGMVHCDTFHMNKDEREHGVQSNQATTS